MINNFLKIEDEDAIEVYITGNNYISLGIIHKSDIVLLSVDDCDRLIEMLEEARSEVYEGVDDPNPICKERMCFCNWRHAHLD